MLCLSGLRRCWVIIFGSPWPLKALLVTWQAAVILGCTGNIVWSRRWHQSYARWREAPAAALRMATFGMGLGGVLMRGLMDAAPLPLPAGAAAAALPGSSAGLEGSVGGMLGVGTHLLRLLFISGTVHLLLLAMAWRVRLRCVRTEGSGAAGRALLLECGGLPPNCPQTALKPPSTEPLHAAA